LIGLAKKDKPSPVLNSYLRGHPHMMSWLMGEGV
jgi:hypothetical protein